ncbi:MAG: response regulator transcription factor [Acidobacteriaceae bacterium]|nr:response regulator transcription factor [Acidobacteriaceae bacterium]MBV9782047.1 response regulator transcription factor [Acidobacteriaceae bacterium]
MTSATEMAHETALPKVLIADDHHLILDALKQMMKTHFNILAVDNSEAFIDAVERFRPDVAILDVSMPGGDGFSAARKVLQRQPSLPIMFLSMYADSRYVDQAAQLGAKAYLSKRLPAQELISAIQAVLEGEALLSPVPADTPAGPGELTVRQREVLRLIAQGCSAKDIANQLNISVRTAEFHRSAIMERLGMHSTAQMTRYAIEHQLD